MKAFSISIKGLAALFAIALGAGGVASQPSLVPQPSSKIKVRAEVIARDVWSPDIYIESYPPTKTFLVRITELIKGDESNEFILVLNRPSKRRTPFVRAVSEGGRTFRMSLKRLAGCDSSIEGLTENIDGSSSNGTDPLKWLRTNVSPDRKRILPCYLLRDSDFRYLN